MEAKLNNKNIRYLICIILVLMMTFMAFILNEYEIIFPEIAALCVGFIYSYKKPWKVNRSKFIIAMSSASLLGLIITNYLKVDLYYQIIIAYILAITLLIILKISLIPVICAVILPVLLKTDSIIYFIAVSIMCIIIALINKYLEDHHLIDSSEYEPYIVDKQEIILIVARFIFVLVYVYIAIRVNHIYLIAPPLFVTFNELSNPSSHLSNKYLNVMINVIIASLIGFISGYLYHVVNVSILICAIISMVLLWLNYRLTKIDFPPSGALTLLPLILEGDKLIDYPFCVSFSAIVMILVGIFIITRPFNKKCYN